MLPVGYFERKEAKMKTKNRILILRYGLGFILYAAGALVSYRMPVLSAVFFLVLMLSETALCYMERKTLLDLRVLLSYSWIGAVALSALSLSALHTAWTASTWLSSGGFYFFFLFGFDLFNLIKKDAPYTESNAAKRLRRRIFEAIVIVFFLGGLSFLIESLKFEFAYPIFSDEAHAYTDFHITGIHYFVVSLMFVPTLSVLYLRSGKPEKGAGIWLIAMNLLSFLVPVLTLSKFQVMITLGMPFIMWLVTESRIRGKYLMLLSLLLFLIVGAAFVFLISRRSYPEGYLGRVFSFKDPDTPMLVQYPYVYIVNNLENLNLLARYSDGFTFGRRSLYPFFALTGLKFLPSVRAFLSVPRFLTREELTTLSMIYDIYGDFGLPGTFIFGGALGFLSAYVSDNVSKKKTVIGTLLFCQLAFYLTLSFFTTWFSNPTTIFWFIATLAIAVWCTKDDGKLKFRLSRFKEDIYDS